MGVKTRIGTDGLLGGVGSVEMPEGVTLCCPQCKTLVADKGQCLAEFIMIPLDEPIGDFSLGIHVDCRNCGCSSKPPSVVF